MKNIKIYFAVLLVIVFITNCKQEKGLSYPETKKVDTINTYFSVEVADPYRWLEDDNSDETKAWVVEQNKVTETYLDSIPYREKIKERLTSIWNYPKYGTPFKKGGKYYFYKNDGLQAQYVLYKSDSLDGEAKVFLDPNTFSDDGTVALSGISFNKEGNLLAYSISSGGSDWREVFVMNAETGEKLSDNLKWIKFSGMSWKGNGFYYSRYDEPKEGDKLKGENINSKIYYHKIGTEQSDDVLVFENPEFPKRGNYAGTIEDESILILSSSEPGKPGNSYYYKELDVENAEFIAIDEGFEFDYSIIDRIENTLLIRTNFEAPKYKVIAVDIKNPAKENWVDFIPEKEETMNGASIKGGMLITYYMKDASDKAYVYDLEGNFKHEVALPGLGSIGGFSGKKDENMAFYTFTSFTYPKTIFKYDIANNTSEVYKRSEIDFDSDAYETKQVFYKSKDGTKIPMFIVHKKGIKLNGQNPTLLYAYGGFNISLTPSFSIANLVFLENGGIYCLANLRGGGEYGEEWHKAGTKMQKQNVFNDFIAAAEYLIAEKYTCSEKLAMRGGSNGGLLVGAVMCQRPELFKVALPAVGVMDMLRYHKFTIGFHWANDYGTSDDSKEMFEYLHKYSPLHALKKGTSYPATMVTTADHDDRVVPAHSFKFAARLQECHVGENPVLIRIESKAGHSAGKPTEMVIEEYTDMWSFVFYNLGMKMGE